LKKRYPETGFVSINWNKRIFFTCIPSPSKIGLPFSDAKPTSPLKKIQLVSKKKSYRWILTIVRVSYLITFSVSEATVWRVALGLGKIQRPGPTN
jgi:hypothetical protein